MLNSRLPAIIAELKPKVNGALAVGAHLVEERAKQRVPVDQGDLKAAIHVDRRGPLTYSVTAGDNDTFYGHIVEHGGGNSPPQPFLVPALEESVDEVRALVAVALRSL